jgi:2-polyprenyl-3-methyl-5-hydroxy-6-metoxy-1,4-benzoquinol methylase
MTTVPVTSRQCREAAVYNARASELDEQLDDASLLVDGRTPPYPNREHVEFMDFLFGRLGDPRGKRILEVGCGSGTLSTYLALRGALAVGVDVSAGMLALARRRADVNGVSGRVELLASPLEDLAEDDASFDAVIGNQVLHHLDLPRAMPNIARLTGDRGVALFAEPVLFVPEFARRARNSRFVTRVFPSRADTPDERSIDIDALDFICDCFIHSEMRAFQVTARLQNFVALSDAAFARLEHFDRALLASIPGTWRIARYVALVLSGAGSPSRTRVRSRTRRNRP